MILNKKTQKNPYRLFIKKLVRQGIDSAGNKYIQTQWIEVSEANLGSIKKPNKEILDIALIPIEDETDEKMTFDDIFRKFFR